MCFSTLKILATVKLALLTSFRKGCFSTLKILATVKHVFDIWVSVEVLVPLRF